MKKTASFEGMLDKDVKPLTRSTKRASIPPKSGATKAKGPHRENAEGSSGNRPRGNEHEEIEFVQPDDVLVWKETGVQPDVFRKLKEGEYPIRRKLDLHGTKVPAARELINKFVAQCIDRDFRCVQIVHGTGKLSNPPAQMKSFVRHWLIQHAHVLAFATAPPRLGGKGAVLVKIQKSQRAKEQNRERHGR